MGCYDDNDRIVDLNWNDPNNDQHLEMMLSRLPIKAWCDWLNFDNDGDGKLFCVRAPENSDAETIPITISVEDNRPSNPLSTEFSFDLELIEMMHPSLPILEIFQIRYRLETLFTLM